MKLPSNITAGYIAEYLGAKIIGDKDLVVTGLNEIHKVEPGDIAFVDHEKYYDKTLRSNATVILTNKVLDCPEGKVLLISEQPFFDFNKLILHFSSFEKSDELISRTAKIGENTVIQPGTFIGNNVVIGNNCIIHANVSIYHNCVIGDNVIIHSGTVIGGDAFYYQKNSGAYQKFNSCGRVVIKDDVEIGANSTIDKGVTGDTIIGNGTKLDNLVHVGHDCVVGDNCLFAAHVGIAGATTIEDNVTLWGQVGVTSGITIGENATVFAQAGVSKSLKGGNSYVGSPAKDYKQKSREFAAVSMLPKIIQNLK